MGFSLGSVLGSIVGGAVSIWGGSQEEKGHRRASKRLRKEQTKAIMALEDALAESKKILFDQGMFSLGHIDAAEKKAMGIIDITYPRIQKELEDAVLGSSYRYASGKAPGNLVAGVLDGGARRRGGAIGALEEGRQRGRGDLLRREQESMAALEEGRQRGRGDLLRREQESMDAVRTASELASEKIASARDRSIQELTDAEAKAGRVLTEEEELAITDNIESELQQDLKLIASEAAAKQSLDPYMQSGQRGLSLLTDAPGDIKASAYYQRRLDEGTKRIERAYAKRGLFGSAASTEALRRFTEQITAEETEKAFDRRFRRGSILADYGAAASSQMANISRQIGGQRADLGAAAASRRGGLRETFGSARAGISERFGRDRAGLLERTGSELAGVEERFGRDRAGLLERTGSELAGMEERLGARKSGISENFARLLSDMETLTATQKATLLENLGVRKAGVTERATALEARLAQQSGSARANIADVYGARAAKMTRQTGVNIGNALLDTGKSIAENVIKEKQVRAGTITTVGDDIEAASAAMFI